MATNPALKTSAEYSEGSIRVLKGLEPVKQRPGMYTRTDNPLHVIQEVLDNAADEALAGYGKKIKVTLHTDGSTSIEDDGRGIPYGLHPEEKAPVIELVRGHLRVLVDGAPADVGATLDPEGRSAVGARIGPERLDELLTLAKMAEHVVGGPADIEWAVTAAGVVLLQARPMTGLSSPTITAGIALLPVVSVYTWMPCCAELANRSVALSSRITCLKTAS